MQCGFSTEQENVRTVAQRRGVTQKAVANGHRVAGSRQHAKLVHAAVHASEDVCHMSRASDESQMVAHLKLQCLPHRPAQTHHRHHQQPWHLHLRHPPAHRDGPARPSIATLHSHADTMHAMRLCSADSEALWLLRAALDGVLSAAGMAWTCALLPRSQNISHAAPLCSCAQAVA